MVTQELLQYVQNATQQGVSADSILQALITSGWSPEDVQQAFVQLGYQTQQPSNA